MKSLDEKSTASGSGTDGQIILIDKPAGISSFGVVARVRRRMRDEFGRKVKVGHTGTLDPFATGLLILLSGKMTKKSGEFLKLDKEYEARLKLGYVSSTGDPEGEIHEVLSPLELETLSFTEAQSPLELGTDDSRPSSRGSRPQLRPVAEEAPTPEVIAPLERTVSQTPETTVPSEAQVEEVLQSFVGEIQQTVPRFSAVKINGQRAYKLARAGKEFETPTRAVKIYEIEILNYAYPELEIRCKVSSGTYIRTLAEDIGKKLGTGAYLTALRRTQIGDYRVERAEKLE